ncbi:phosphatidylinositol kinase [Thiorhodococcus mannitoliphagus]|uniref:Phosphatidylinositol kinase n=1 Tax=Thiorhodococcus mannitoliphagus TaxID=329406 RepID=A0A6P1DRG3_9GAMM|nr:phosphatidylinositol kinase [Thiorhodococcus mannitoliphagus]NEX19763.1 phosphatidylinositol kinase [Thiorhodococcus mannitoliphagus]
MAFPVRIIDTGVPELLEQLGTKKKSWVRLDDCRYLFKIGRPGTGENWAEVIAARLASMLGIPHADYELAVRGNEKGVLSPLIVPEGGRLIAGNELLAKIHPEYRVHEVRQVSDHTLRRIHGLLTHPAIGFPPDWRPPSDSIMTAYDLFLGYLLLDAWIANQDRHHENWGVIYHQRRIYLSPSFDHAASMGQNETDCNREERLTTRDRGRHISTYVIRARSAIYERQDSAKPLKTVELFDKAASRSPAAAQTWLGQLERIGTQDIAALFAQLQESEASQIAKTFAMRLLELNRERLLKSLTP